MKKNNHSLYRFKTDLYLRNFNKVNRKTKKIDKTFFEKNKKIDKFLKNNSNLIVILHQRWAINFLETYFDNKEGFKETHLLLDDYFEPIDIETLSLNERQKYLEIALTSQINRILNYGHKLVLVYPVPEMGFHVPNLFKTEFFKQRNLNSYQIPILTGSYEVYKKRNELIFNILDSIQSPNIYRVYPHKFFCDVIIKDRCAANNNENIFYADDDHLSLDASKLVVDEIIDKIKKINISHKID